MIVIVDQNKLKKDPVAELLINKLQEYDFSDSNVYYNFPFYRGESKGELVQAHVLFVSKEYGVIFFRCVGDLEQVTDVEKRKLDELDSHIFSRINKIDELRIKRRELKINVSPVVFINSQSASDTDEHISFNTLKDFILNNKKDVLNQEEFEQLVSSIEGTVHLRNKKDRASSSKGNVTKGDILNILQNKHATFDVEQKRAALNIIDSPQRIRGLAGSGKTIILTMKAALYHLQNPEAEILYTYFTKALYGQIKYLIEKYYRDFSENREPDWSKIHILHGWGGRGLRGVYSDTCQENNISPISFFEAKRNDKQQPFDYIFQQLEKQELKEKFDLTLIDEGQDFPQHFYQVCRKITKNLRIVWAYDDFQNIFDVNIQDEKETFGKDPDGNYYVDFSRDDIKLQDIVLHKCYRNPRLALLNAFSLGLGIYNDKVLQRLEDNSHWSDLGFTVEEGDSSVGSKMVVSRSVENSPLETNDLFDDQSVKIEVFDDINQECEYVVDQIGRDINDNNLRADDICVISIDSKNIENYFDLIEKLLSKKGIDAFNHLNAPNNNTQFSLNQCVTLSTLNKAKGNESGMVYIIGVDSVFRNKDYIIDRNKLFTAITRSKGWVTLTGYPLAETCRKEMNQLKANDYKLIFHQPSVEETKMILRGISKEQSDLNEITLRLQDYAKNTGLSTEEILKLLATSQKVKK